MSEQYRHCCDDLHLDTTHCSLAALTQRPWKNWVLCHHAFAKSHAFVQVIHCIYFHLQGSHSWICLRHPHYMSSPKTTWELRRFLALYLLYYCCESKLESNWNRHWLNQLSVSATAGTELKGITGVVLICTSDYCALFLFFKCKHTQTEVRESSDLWGIRLLTWFSHSLSWILEFY